MADHVIATNDSYREIAIRRSGKPATDVTVVRTGPDHGVFDAVPPIPHSVGAAGSLPTR